MIKKLEIGLKNIINQRLIYNGAAYLIEIINHDKETKFEDSILLKKDMTVPRSMSGLQ